MISHEKRLVITNVFRRLGWAILIGAAWVIGLQLLFIFGELIIDHRLDSFLVSLQGVPGMLPPILNIVLVGYFLITAYSDFKWTIQNGVSRKTLWWGRLIALFLSSCGIWIVNELLGLFNHPLQGWGTMGMQFLLLLNGAVTAMMIGNGFGLLNRTWKWIVGIGLPILFILLLALFAQMVVSLSPSVDYANWFGPHSILVTILSSSVTCWIVWGIYVIIVLLLAKLFNDRMQLRRD